MSFKYSIRRSHSQPGPPELFWHSRQEICRRAKKEYIKNHRRTKLLSDPWGSLLGQAYKFFAMPENRCSIDEGSTKALAVIYDSLAYIYCNTDRNAQLFTNLKIISDACGIMASAEKDWIREYCPKASDEATSLTNCHCIPSPKRGHCPNRLSATYTYTSSSSSSSASSSPSFEWDSPDYGAPAFVSYGSGPLPPRAPNPFDTNLFAGPPSEPVGYSSHLDAFIYEAKPGGPSPIDPFQFMAQGPGYGTPGYGIPTGTPGYGIPTGTPGYGIPTGTPGYGTPSSTPSGTPSGYPGSTSTGKPWSTVDREPLNPDGYSRPPPSGYTSPTPERSKTPGAYGTSGTYDTYGSSATYGSSGTPRSPERSDTYGTYGTSGTSAGSKPEIDPRDAWKAKFEQMQRDRDAANSGSGSDSDSE